MKQFWHNLFLTERPSISLSLFRICAALTTGFYVIPTLVPLQDNYFAGAFRTVNTNFFPVWFIELAQKSPDALVVVVVVVFCLSWFSFLIGLFSRASCIVMTACCYFFYALNHFAVGHALTWDILLVTLFMLCVTSYHGDYFSVDCLRRGDTRAYKTARPYFIQRLLQMQIAFTYFYTGLYKITGSGNWLTDNPIYYLLNYPPGGVTKDFLLKTPLSHYPQLCYILGLIIVFTELAMPVLLWCRRTRVSGIYLGVIFHITLILTLDVPAIFFFLFPPMLLLFINPEKIIAWIEEKRLRSRRAGQSRVVFDGHCQFCKRSVNQLAIMDLFATLDMVDYQELADPKSIHPELTRDLAHSQLHVVEPDGQLSGGFWAFRKLCLKLPMLFPLIPVFYFPGSGIFGPLAYRWVAKNRYLFHSNKTCKNNACYR